MLGDQCFERESTEKNKTTQDFELNAKVTIEHLKLACLVILVLIFKHHCVFPTPSNSQSEPRTVRTGTECIVWGGGKGETENKPECM